MIRFFLWTGVASALSSILFFPFAGRAILAGWAIAWAVRWTVRVESVGRSRAVAFLICGILTGIAGGLAIIELDIIQHWAGLFPRKNDLFDFSTLTFAGCLVVPIVTTLYVLGIGWCHLNRKRAYAWILMGMALVIISLLRGMLANYDGGEGFKADRDAIVNAFFLFCLFGALPFALLWLAAAWIAKRTE